MDELHGIEEITFFPREKWETFFKTLSRSRNELYGAWLAESEEEQKLRKLAEQYHTRCDFFDKSLLPYDGEDRGRMNANALRVRDEIIQQGLSMGFTRRQVEEAIRKYSR